MAQTLIRFDTPVYRDGRQFDVRACGRERENGQWEGIEMNSTKKSHPTILIRNGSAVEQAKNAW